jgi:hypothetical protein
MKKIVSNSHDLDMRTIRTKTLQERWLTRERQQVYRKACLLSRAQKRIAHGLAQVFGHSVRLLKLKQRATNTCFDSREKAQAAGDIQPGVDCLDALDEVPMKFGCS